ncbi:carboxymuconolactone decarboxylase family protein [Microbacterium horticulturae]|uniref:Carboxymuconolactone decarboxylase family protein n=1 Tax=Microbacterium horticulturae TaxID=3028316 RepID=A0ABY8C466_9MICO|nr:carboxymuconolactone decarboxylase family protein [Microbacterium sp. KACC 23027]WEG09990.1 carboxymuconolactone decarboxylase family protein [Microbacterium sp. KACC 23027]
MSERMSIQNVDPDAYRAVLALEKYVNGGTVDESVLLLVKIRASQINRCAWCLDMHLTEARDAGMDQRKLDVLAGWNEAGSLFDDRERAVLAFAEEVTLVSEHGVSDDTWAGVRAHFDEKQTVTLLMAACAINVWNRMNVTAQTVLPPK